MDQYPYNNNQQNQNYNPQNYSWQQPAGGVQWSGGSYHSGPSVSPESPGKRSRKGHFAALVAVCLVISLLGGFLGGFAAQRLGTGERTVIYQSSGSGSALQTDSSASLSGIVELVAPTVVQITTESVSTSSFWGQYVTSGAGSGVIISEDGYIVTNNHVISGTSKIVVTTYDNKEYPATLIGTDSRTDIAVIKIDAQGLTAAVMGDSDSLKVGDFALAVGNPLGELGGTVTDGIISALSREVVVGTETMTLLQTNAAINPGNSGGGLFDASGRLIGIVNAKSSGSDIEGLGFAIPINTARPVVEDLLTTGYVTGRPALGVTLLEISDYRTAMTYRVQYLGVYIQAVTEGSGAAAAGALPGDYIMSIDEKQVESVSDVTAVLNKMSIGDTVALTVIRDGKTLNLTVTLGESTAS